KGYLGTGLITPFRKPPGGELLPWQKEFNTAVNKIRYVVERAIANFKTWRCMHTDYRRPLSTYDTAFRAVRALHFSKLRFA
ncbi:MAG TPA: transposase family protein, partial [Mycobacteriales bacterium]|nr:transposase family protein [Mycobacteriales bacterium]